MTNSAFLYRLPNRNQRNPLCLFTCAPNPELMLTKDVLESTGGSHCLLTPCRCDMRQATAHQALSDTIGLPVRLGPRPHRNRFGLTPISADQRTDVIGPLVQIDLPGSSCQEFHQVGINYAGSSSVMAWVFGPGRWSCNAW
jgi:hypothetical protein